MTSVLCGIEPPQIILFLCYGTAGGHFVQVMFGQPCRRPSKRRRNHLIPIAVVMDIVSTAIFHQNVSSRNVHSENTVVFIREITPYVLREEYMDMPLLEAMRTQILSSALVAVTFSLPSEYCAIANPRHIS